ncbi:unnamed protein product, partial [Didymodactylos carnosus]
FMTNIRKFCVKDIPMVKTAPLYSNLQYMPNLIEINLTIDKCYESVLKHVYQHIFMSNNRLEIVRIKRTDYFDYNQKTFYFYSTNSLSTWYSSTIRLLNIDLYDSKEMLIVMDNLPKIETLCIRLESLQLQDNIEYKQLSTKVNFLTKFSLIAIIIHYAALTSLIKYLEKLKYLSFYSDHVCGSHCNGENVFNRIIDGNILKNDILSKLKQLEKFQFYIGSLSYVEMTNDDIITTFQSDEWQKWTIGCFTNKYREDSSLINYCIYSLPYNFQLVDSMSKGFLSRTTNKVFRKKSADK